MKQIQVVCTIASVMYSRSAEFSETPVIGDLITMWKHVRKNKSTNYGVIFVVVEREWDNRNGSVRLHCVSKAAISVDRLKDVGFS